MTPIDSHFVFLHSGPLCSCPFKKVLSLFSLRNRAKTFISLAPPIEMTG